MKKAFLIRLTEEEFDRVTALANATALSREAFVRRVLQGAAITEKPPAEYGEIVRELRRIGSDVNQLLVKARLLGFVEFPKLEETLVLLRRMDDTFTKVFAERYHVGKQ